MTRTAQFACIFFLIFHSALSHVTEHDDGNPFEKEMGDEMAELEPEQIKEKLGEIFVKIDTNADGKLDTPEMMNWITNVTHNFMEHDADRFWKDNGVAEGQNLSWEAYEKVYLKDYGGAQPDAVTEEGSNHQEMVDRLLEKDRTRWKAADTDGDGLLSKKEMVAFSHPEEFEHTRLVVAKELHADVDKNKDGSISLEEYLEDMGLGPDRKVNHEDAAEEENHLKQETDTFHNTHDKNKDGVLDFDEFADWVSPSTTTYSANEARDLLKEADTDKDGMISVDEMKENYKAFIGSQITEYGDLVHGRHDEL